MKKTIVVLVLGMIGGSLSPLVGQVGEGQLKGPETESGHYAFLGARLLVKHKDQMCPVTLVDDGKLYLDTDYGVKKAKEIDSCTIEPVVGISSAYLQIENVKIDYSNGKRADLESALMKEADRMERETKFAIQTGDLSTSTDSGADDAGGYDGDFGDIDPYSEAGEALQNIGDYQEQVESMVRDGDLEIEGTFDTLAVKMNLTSNVDLEDVVCAVVVKYVKDDAYSRFMNERGSSIRIHMLKDLMGEIPDEVSIYKVIGSGVYRQDTAQIEFYFFDKNGEPIASNQSSGLKMLTHSQLERLSASGS